MSIIDSSRISSFLDGVIVKVGLSRWWWQRTMRMTALRGTPLVNRLRYYRWINVSLATTSRRRTRRIHSIRPVLFFPSRSSSPSSSSVLNQIHLNFSSTLLGRGQIYLKPSLTQPHSLIRIRNFQNSPRRSTNCHNGIIGIILQLGNFLLCHE